MARWMLLDGRTFAVGDRFTALDVMLASYLGWYMDTGVLDKRPVFEAYVGRHRGRDAAARANAIDDAEMTQRGRESRGA